MHTSFRILIMLFPFFFAGAQQTDFDFLSARVAISPDTTNAALDGNVSYVFRVNGAADSLALDARDMIIKSVTLEGSEIPFAYNGKRLKVSAPGSEGLHKLRIIYTARPRQTLYFFGWNDTIAGNEQIWTQGQGKYSSHWVPSFDDMQEKLVFDLDISFDARYTVIANGKLQSKEVTNSRATWHYRMDNPMSSYLLAFAIGHFQAANLQAESGIPLLNFYPEEKAEAAQNTYRHTAAIFDFLEQEIGYPYPWSDYKQVPLHDFMYAGMENTTATFFSDRYLTDSIANNDLPYLNINAHEMAHQWFGNLVTEADGKHHWLHEGFATYYAYLAEASVLGGDQMYWKLFDSSAALQQAQEQGSGKSLLDPGADSLTFYEKGAWALFILRELLGDDVFRTGIQNYLQKFAFGNATVDDFLDTMERESGKELGTFREVWLESPEFAFQEALEYLKLHSETIRRYMELEELVKSGIPSERELYEAWEYSDLPSYRRHIITSFGNYLPEEILEQVLQKGSIAEQKALLFGEQNAPARMLDQASPLLDAPSYELREALLYRLWLAYPDKRRDILQKLEHNGSLEYLPLRQSWLLLAALTPDYQKQQAENLAALRKTTGASYSADTREKAFSLLHQVEAFNDQNIKDLLQSTEHHRWAFKKFARELFLEFLEKRPEREYWEMMARGLNRETYAYIYEKIEAL